jgi:hypothetical protein
LLLDSRPGVLAEIILAIVTVQSETLFNRVGDAPRSIIDLDSNACRESCAKV